ncbi:hypothetical protein Phi18:3_gp103 [Cellulophaga phage phi18:3]|uniref:Uncharacterized protein n=1 Tax=Cellulophaga phage phi18:3 TaxID=1327983 RepID=S0A1E5_9CAUD|nr:hypothetical protein Phi18:3_gp103 [Cellulophaga phage phi18:3]AGO48615.1 hypothetical protein Phi18:3_gp103 [Cellulophaga phage phi18:3]
MESIGKNFLNDFDFTDDNAATQPEAAVPEVKAEEETTGEVVETPEVVTEEVVEETTTEVKADTEVKEKPEVEVKKEEKVVEEVKYIELDDDAIKAYFKEKKGKDIESIDDLFKTPEKAVDPLEGLSDEAIQFINYSKETGRGFSDFAELNKDFTKMTPLEIAQKKAIDFSDGEFTSSEAIEFIEKELNIDLSEDLDKFDLIKLKGYGKDWLNNKIQDQKKYKQPIERSASQEGPEMVTLENGVNIPKEQYENLTRQREQYLEGLQKSQDNITASTFQVTIDENGEEIKMDISYDFSQKDKHNMLSAASDTDKFIQESFSKDGVVDYAKLQKAMFFAQEENMGKVISSAVNKARAEWIEESVKNKTNANFSTKSKMPSEQQKGRIVPIPGTSSTSAIPFSVNDF